MSKHENKIIELLLERDLISKNEYSILMLKDYENTDSFNTVLQKVVNLQLELKKESDIIDLSHIQFPEFNYTDFSFPDEETVVFDRSIFYKKVNFFNTVVNSNLYFADVQFKGEVDFSKSTINEIVSFDNSHFYEESNFSNMICKKSIYFHNVTFYKKTHFHYSKFKDLFTFNHTEVKEDIYFHDTIFDKESLFWGVRFNKNAYFSRAKFLIDADFSTSVCKDFIDFSEVSLGELNLENTRYNKSSFLGLHGSNSDIHADPISKENLKNKESARIIKANFESLKNNNEANKFFAIEQELYIDELKKGFPPSKHALKNLFVLYLNKYVSFFGTDWMRALLSIFIFGFVASLGYDLLINEHDLFVTLHHTLYLSIGLVYSIIFYISYNLKSLYFFIFLVGIYSVTLIISSEIRLISNDMSKLINPLSIFKGQDYFIDIAPYGIFVKVVTAALIYQFIVAFRSQTKR